MSRLTDPTWKVYLLIKQGFFFCGLMGDSNLGKKPHPLWLYSSSFDLWNKLLVSDIFIAKTNLEEEEEEEEEDSEEEFWAWEGEMSGRLLARNCHIFVRFVYINRDKDPVSDPVLFNVTSGQKWRHHHQPTVSWDQSLGGWHFFGREVPNLQKVGIDKTATPLFGQKNFYDPPSPIHLTP